MTLEFRVPHDVDTDASPPRPPPPPIARGTDSVHSSTAGRSAEPRRATDGSSSTSGSSTTCSACSPPRVRSSSAAGPSTRGSRTSTSTDGSARPRVPRRWTSRAGRSSPRAWSARSSPPPVVRRRCTRSRCSGRSTSSGTRWPRDEGQPVTWLSRAGPADGPGARPDELERRPDAHGRRGRLAAPDRGTRRGARVGARAGPTGGSIGDMTSADPVPEVTPAQPTASIAASGCRRCPRGHHAHDGRGDGQRRRCTGTCRSTAPRCSRSSTGSPSGRPGGR